jgi:hypothetical protein
MEIQKIIFDFIQFAKNLVLSFFLSIFRSKDFFLTDKYKIYKFDGKVYLFISLFVYLMFYTIRTKILLLPEAILEVDALVNGSSILEVFIYTLPLLLYSFLIIWLCTKYISQKGYFNPSFFGFTLFSNALLIEAFLWFIIAILFNLIQIFIPGDFFATYLNNYKTFYVISKAIGYIILVVPSLIFLLLVVREKKLIHFGIIILVLICSFADNIVQSFYRTEFMMFKEQNEMQVINSISGNESEWDLYCEYMRDSSCTVFTNFVIKNNTNKVLTLRMDRSVTFHSILYYAIDSTNYEKNINDSLFYELDNLIGSINTDSKIMINDKPIEENLVLKPGEMIEGKNMKTFYDKEMYFELIKIANLLNSTKEKLYLKIQVDPILNNNQFPSYEKKVVLGKIKFI